MLGVLKDQKLGTRFESLIRNDLSLRLLIDFFHAQFKLLINIKIADINDILICKAQKKQTTKLRLQNFEKLSI